jgi:hypothetical protein
MPLSTCSYFAAFATTVANPRRAKNSPMQERFKGKPVKHPRKSLWLDPADAGPSVSAVDYERNAY